jgi:hypothetical protein
MTSEAIDQAFYLATALLAALGVGLGRDVAHHVASASMTNDPIGI